MLAVSMLAGCIVLAGCSAQNDRSVAGPGTTEEIGSPSAAAHGSAACNGGGSVPPETDRRDYRTDGQERVYTITVPTQPPDGPMPLVVGLHGATGTATHFDEAGDLPALAEEKGFVLLSPQAIDPARFWRLHYGNPDIDFVRELVADTTERICIDLDRIYLAGFSLGGMMAMAMACETPDRYAGIAVVAGLVDLPCDRDAPVPMVAIHGSADETVRFDGTYPEGMQLLLGGPSRPRDQIAQDWARVNGCSIEGSASTEAGVLRTVAYECPTGADVRFSLIEGGRHRWPGSPPDAISGPDPPDGDVEASRMIWDFFESTRA
jgi:polyhydroxybutyrate depolymerase